MRAILSPGYRHLNSPQIIHNTPTTDSDRYGDKTTAIAAGGNNAGQQWEETPCR